MKIMLAFIEFLSSDRNQISNANVIISLAESPECCNLEFQPV